MNLEALQEAIQAEGVDGWLFFDHHRRDPLAYRILHLPASLNPTRRWYYLVPAHGEPVALLHRIEPNVLDSLPGLRRLYSHWKEQQEELKQTLSGLKAIAMQYSPSCAIPYVSMIDAGTVELVRSVGIDVRSAANLIQLFEARWTDEQFETHLEAGRLVDAIRAEAFRLIGERLHSGHRVYEFQVAEFIRTQFREKGLYTDHGPIVAVNANASNPHYEPTQEQSSTIRGGDLVLIDLWAKLDRPNSVYYDVTWTAYCGSAIPPEIDHIFRIVTGARDAAVDLIQKSSEHNATLMGFEVDDAARNYIQRAGYGSYFIHRTGHSIGVEVHGSGANMDNFETHDERTLLEKTCFSIEPGVYLPSFGIRSEVNVYMGDSPSVTGEIQRGIVKLVAE